MTSVWTGPDDIAARVARRWDDGTLLRRLAANDGFEPIEVVLRGPTAAQIGDDLAAVRTWIHALDARADGGRRYTLVRRAVGGRLIGRNELPDRAVVSSYAQAWALLGVARSVRRFESMLALTAAHPAVHAWVGDHPHQALALQGDLPQILAAYAWLNYHRGSARYLREISAPGVDTKFAERHRATLASMLRVSATPAGFLSDLGLRSKPAFVRIRPAPSLGLPGALSEIAARADEVAGLPLRPAAALVVENETTYLSVPIPADGIVIWGKGFAVDAVGRLPWLVDVPIRYWGDLDTHGFAILDRLRSDLPQVASVLMDADTLLAHRDRWVIEDRPTTADLTRLTAAERDLYAGLVADSWGDRVRLEQELVDWTWAADRLVPDRP